MSDDNHTDRVTGDMSVGGKGRRWWTAAGDYEHYITANPNGTRMERREAKKQQKRKGISKQ